MTFLFLLLPDFPVVSLRRLDPVFDEIVGEEEGEGFEDFEDQANQGKQPFDHDSPLFFIDKFSVCMMTLLNMNWI